MNTIFHAVLLIVGFVALSLLGQWIVSRTLKIEVLQQHHSAGEAMMGAVGTLFSVLLGFMVAAAMSQYADAKMHDELEATNVANVFRIARGLSDEDRPRIRQLCRDYVDDVISKEWPMMQRREKINHGWDVYQKLWEAVVAMHPENDRQNNLEQPLIEAMKDLGEHRRARILLSQMQMPVALWFVVGIGAIATMSLSYVFASQFPRVQALMTTLVATALALNIWMLSAYSHPYSGELTIQPTMFQLLKESVLTVPDTPSRFLHDEETSAASPKANEVKPAK